MTKRAIAKSKNGSPPLQQLDATKCLEDTGGLVSAEASPLGLFDQKDLYPHLISVVGGIRVAVPLGEPDDEVNKNYVVAPFTYQSVPQPEYGLGRYFEIDRVKLLTRDRDARPFLNLGSIKVHSDGSLFMYCMGYRGYTAWVPIPGCTSRKRPGNVNNSWEIMTKSPGAGQNVTVRYDGASDEFDFKNWPEDS